MEEPPTDRFFDLGNIIPNAALSAGEKWPVVLMSHGTGGTAESLGWLAFPLAQAGYVVLGANHHGNTGLEDYLAEGFLCWWERASDLSILLSTLAEAGTFADCLDLNRVSAVGFSLGGYTVISLAGARTSIDAFDAWRRSSGSTQDGPREFPDLASRITDLVETSDVFRRSWARHGEDFSDPRVKSVIAIAPAPPVRSFLPESVSSISLPVTLITGDADTEAPTEDCGAWLATQNPRFRHHALGPDVGHYTFLGYPADRSLIGQLDIFCDHVSVNRRQIHRQTSDLVLRSLEQIA